MCIRKLFLALVVCLSLPAAAEFTTIERAYEIALSDFTVPVSQSGSVMFRQCADCETKIVRMTQATSFVINGESVELKEFRKSVFEIRDRVRTTVIVMHHLESDTITAVKVNL